ncbi:MAG: ATP-binding cassette domain-containing protein [Bdellovibrio sp.]|nr:ATP-binding cassette domain-containing protein [Bdellovibrio sp.]
MSSEFVASSPLIVTRELTKEYVTRQTTKGFQGLIQGWIKPKYINHNALSNINLTLDPGEILGVLGPNGAGKSTLIKLLTGIQTPTSGNLSVLGFKPSERSRRFLQQIGVVFGHKSSLWWDLPARMSFESIAVIYGIDQEIFHQTLKQLTTILGLTSVIDRPIRVLSLGERVKCEVAAALLHGPRLLFLDEPTVGLDITSRTELRELLKAYAAEKGIGIILTSHDVGDIEACCDRVVLVNQGAIAFDGKIESLKKSFSDVLKIHLKTEDERNFVQSEVDELQQRLQSVLIFKHEIKSSNAMAITVRRQHSQEALKTIIDLNLRASIEVKNPELEEVLLHHFRAFRQALIEN